MPWKTDSDGNLVVESGNPVWIYPDKKEAPFDAEQALEKISSLNNESADRRRKLGALEDRLKVLDGIDDPASFLTEARKALEVVKNLDDKKLVDAGKLDELKSQLTKDMQEKLGLKDSEIQKLQQALHTEMIGGRFSRSRFAAEKLAIPSDLVEKAFSDHFKIEDGRVVAYDANGEVIRSRENFGEPAGFDEALSVLVDKYPHKDRILKAAVGDGTGARESDTMTRSGQVSRHDNAGIIKNLDKVASGEVKVT